MTERLGSEPTSTGRVLPERLLETHVAHVLFDAQRARRTGTLTVAEATVETRLRVADGTVVFAEAGTLAETLGRVLVRSGKIDREEYLLILERMAEPSEQDEVMRFGEVAISMGMLEPADLGEALALQVKVKLQHCLLVDEAAWTWTDGPAPSPGATFPTRLEPVLREALREDPQGYRWPGLLVAQRKRVVHLDGRPDEIAARFGASAAELRLLRHLDQRPLETVLSSGILEPQQTGAFVACLMFAGALRLGAHASDRLSVQPPAATPAAHRTFARPKPDAARREPDAAPPGSDTTHHRTVDGGARRGPTPSASGRTRGVAGERGEARAPAAAEPAGATGTDPTETDRARDAAERLRAEMERRGRAASSQRSRVDAERAFEKGRALLSRGAVHAARAELEQATELMPEAAEYQLYLRWCEYLDETDEVRRPVYEQLLRATVLEALTQDRKMAFAHYVQGRLYMLDEDEAAAERAFRIAAHLDPDDIEVTRHLRLLSRRRKG